MDANGTTAPALRTGDTETELTGERTAFSVTYPSPPDDSSWHFAYGPNLLREWFRLVGAEPVDDTGRTRCYFKVIPGGRPE